MKVIEKYIFLMYHIFCVGNYKLSGKGEKMKFKRIQSAILATVLTCSMAVTPVFAESTQDQLENQKATAQDELSKFQKQLNDLIEKTNDLETQLIDTGNQISQAKVDLKAANEKKESQKEAMKIRIKYMYESSTGSATMEKVITSGDMTSVLTQAEYSQRVHEYDREQLDEYAATVKQIEDLQSTLEKKMDNLESLETEYKQQQDELNTTIASKQDEISNLDEMIQEAARKAAEEAAKKAAAEKKKQEEEQAAQKKAQQEAQQQQAQQEAQQQAQQETQQQTQTVTQTPTQSTPTYTEPTYSEPTYNEPAQTEPTYNAVTGNAVVDRAYSKIGCWYSWGACGPDTFDCSGLVSYCLTGSYTRLGTTTTFMGWTQVSNPQPGDICTSATHCGIYIGNGQMIHAPQDGEQVKIGPVQSDMIYVRY